MNIGPLDKRCKFERRVTGQDPVYGTPVDTWETVGVLWGSVQDVLPSRSESVKEGLTVATSRTRLRIRHTPGLDSAMRVTINRPSPVVYQIVAGPAELDGKMGTELMLEAFSS
jgi:head-tail adaptor